MKISTKGRYALRMVADIAAHSDNSYISLKEISERQQISKKYLEQIVPLLSRSGILKTIRGNKGGYSLAVPPSELTVGAVLRAAEGSLAPVACLEYEELDCPRASECPTLPIWQGLYKIVAQYLDGITVRDILDKYGESDGSFCI